MATATDTYSETFERAHAWTHTEGIRNPEATLFAHWYADTFHDADDNWPAPSFAAAYKMWLERN